MSHDTERYEPKSFCMADVDMCRVVFYVYESREPYFLFVTPLSLEKKLPWEVHFKRVHRDPDSYQVHFEFTSDIVLPDWYNQRRVSKVDVVHLRPVAGNYFISFYYNYSFNSFY